MSEYIIDPRDIIASIPALLLASLLGGLLIASGIACDELVFHQCLVKAYESDLKIMLLSLMPFIALFFSFLFVQRELVTTQYTQAPSMLNVMASLASLIFVLPLTLLAIDNAEALWAAELTALITMTAAAVLELAILLTLYSTMFRKHPAPFIILASALIEATVIIWARTRRRAKRGNHNENLGALPAKP